MSTASYVDYDAIASDSFDPYKYANALLLATNDKDDAHVDFTSAQNKLKFDLQEVERAQQREVEENWEALLERTEAAAAAGAHVTTLEHDLSKLELSYAKLEQKTVAPYEEAAPLYASQVKRVETMSLLKHLIAYLEQVGVVKACKDAFSRAGALIELRTLAAATPGLKDMRIFIAPQSKMQDLTAQTIRELSANVGQFKFLASSLGNLALLDHAELLRLVRNTMKDKLEDAAQDAKASLQVSPTLKRLQASDNTAAISQFGTSLETLFSSLHEASNQIVALELALPPASKTQLLQQSFDHSATLAQYFWRELAHKLSGLVREATRSNLWILRTLRTLELDEIVAKGGLKRGTMEFSVVSGALKR